MKMKRSFVLTLILGVLAVCIHLYADDAVRVENQYAAGIYPLLSSLLRSVFGWIPFSFGDILYGLVCLLLIGTVLKATRSVIKKQVTMQGFVAGFSRVFRVLLVIYILFNLFWGINYNRIGIAGQLQLTMDAYEVPDLAMINGLLLQKVNNTKEVLVNQQAKYPSRHEVFHKALEAYQVAEKQYPFLHYQQVSLKPSVWSWVGNYMGFTGYYNPFTGEAQVNTMVPKFLQPFTTCHEIAHQLGYAKEMEANFVAYLAAKQSADTLLQYSVYLDLFMYSNRNLYAADSTSANRYWNQLSPDVMKDVKEWRDFNIKHRNPIEPVFRWVFGKYLEGNQQPQGVLSYDAVTGFLIAYYKKFGKI